MRRAGLIVAAMVLVTGACRSGRESGSAPTTAPARPEEAGTATTAPLPTGGTGGPDIATLLVNNVRLFNSEESDNALRVLFDSAEGDVAVVLTGIPSPNRTILVCPAADLERRAPAGTCSTPADGQPARLPHTSSYKGVEVVQVGVRGTGPAAATTAVAALAVTFTPASRDVQIRLPPVRAGAAGEPASFRLSPAGATGAYRATATWTSPPTGKVELSVVVGGATANRVDGGPGVTLTGAVPSPAEASLRVRNAGSGTLTGLTVTALFP